MVDLDVRTSILTLAGTQTIFQTSDVLKVLPRNVSRQYINRVIGQLVEEGELARNGGGRYTYYSLPAHSKDLPGRLHKRLKNSPELRDYIVFETITKQLGFWKNLSENVRSIINYAFTEMLNNAIEHSKSTDIEVDFSSDRDTVTFVVRDFGIGVFKSVMQKYELHSQLEATQELLKGKTTTAPQAHSGEGIFFTSKVADSFVLDSYGEQLTVDNRLQDIFVDNKRSLKGTLVSFTIAKTSRKHLQDIFVGFQSEPGSLDFDKTEIYIKLFTMGTVHVSRSQAKRVLAGIAEKFKVVVLDFDRVPGIGQAFADEIFRVFAEQHPDIKLEPKNANPEVEFMISRAQKTKR